MVKKSYEDVMDILKEVPGVSEDLANIEDVEWKSLKGKPDCELCDGLGVIMMDDTMEGYGFQDITCECVKERYNG